MALLTWNHASSVGVRALDDQHGILMDTMNELRLAMTRGADREQMNELLGRLIEFLRMHFWNEEQLMEQTGFPGLAEHRSEHEKLLTQLRESARRAQRNENVGMRPLLSFLRDWYSEHIEGPDHEYGPWLNEHGIS